MPKSNTLGRPGAQHTRKVVDVADGHCMSRRGNQIHTLCNSNRLVDQPDLRDEIGGIGVRRDLQPRGAKAQVIVRICLRLPDVRIVNGDRRRRGHCDSQRDHAHNRSIFEPARKLRGNYTQAAEDHIRDPGRDSRYKYGHGGGKPERRGSPRERKCPDGQCCQQCETETAGVLTFHDDRQDNHEHDQDRRPIEATHRNRMP